jgi:predicted nucleic acid-binding protein
VRLVRLLLDTAVVGEICHPRKYDDVRAWFARAAAAHEMLLSEVADYELRRELRRELLRIDSRRSLDRLDELTREIRYIPVTTATWRATARALQRKAGRVTAAEGGLDGDVLIAAQALAEDAVIVTPNTRHFDSMIRAVTWQKV